MATNLSCQPFSQGSAQLVHPHLASSQACSPQHEPTSIISDNHIMATNHSKTPTQTVVKKIEESIPYPTLRLKLTNFKGECEAAKNKIVDQLQKALDDDVENTRALLKKSKPTAENKTQEEYEKEVEEFKKALQIIQGLLKKQADYNVQLVQEVGEYLVESWKMIQDGKSKEECDKYRDDKRRELCEKFDVATTAIKKEVEETVTQGPANTQSLEKRGLQNGKSRIEGGTSDASAIEGGSSDASAMEVGTSDASAMEGGTSDASAMEGGTSDASAIEGVTSDASAMEGGTSDASAIESGTSDASASAIKKEEQETLTQGPAN